MIRWLTTVLTALLCRAKRRQPKQHTTHDNKTKNEFGPSKKMGKKKTTSNASRHRRMQQQRPSSRQTSRAMTPSKAVPGGIGPHSRIKQLEGPIYP